MSDNIFLNFLKINMQVNLEKLVKKAKRISTANSSSGTIICSCEYYSDLVELKNVTITLARDEVTVIIAGCTKNEERRNITIVLGDKYHIDCPKDKEIYVLMYLMNSLVETITEV